MHSTDTTYTERDPLLRGVDESEEESAPIVTQALDEEDDRTLAQRLAIVFPCIMILICFMVGNSMIDVPLNEISEAIVCRNMFGTVPEPASDPRCKESQVQSELALIGGWELTFGFIPSLLVGVPYGLAADKYGRRVVLLLASTGGVLYILAVIIICEYANGRPPMGFYTASTHKRAYASCLGRYPSTFPIRLRWLAPIFMLVGGGVSTLNAIIFTVVADVSTKAYRSTAFMYLATAVTTCGLVASPLTYLMMNGSGAWFTVIFGFVLLALAIPLAALLPETRCTAVVERAAALRNVAERNHHVDKHSSCWNVQPIMRSAWQHLSLINRTLFVGNPTVGILLFSTVFITLGKSVIMLLLQYVAKRFGWSWAKAGLLIGVKHAVSIGLTAIVLPALSQVLLKTGMAPHIKDWWIVRLSAMIGVLGSLAMGMAQTAELFISAMIFTELGGGLQAALRGLVTELVDQTHIALIMTVLSMFLTISEMVAGPLMAQMFKVGMNWGGMWVGMPYIASAAMLSVGTLLVTFLPIGRHMATSPAA